MPVSWELQKANSVVCGILHVETTTIAWSFGLRNLVFPGKQEHRLFDPFILMTGTPFDHGRNLICTQMIQSQWFEWLFFLDSDVIPPRDVILRLLKHNKPIISGIYYRRSPPEGIPVMLKNGMWITQYPQNSVIEVDLVGAGCLLIHKSVLERMPPQRPEAGKHWFDWRVDCKDNPHFKGREGECLSEDFTWNLWARKHGWKILVDTSIICRHVGYSQSMYGSMKPLETVPST